MSGKEKEQIAAGAGVAGLVLAPPLGAAVLVGDAVHYHERKKHHEK